jgi:Uncharacterized protein conserved in bacteria
VNALQLAYLGDSVLEVYVRKHLLQQQIGSIEQLHKRTVHFTNAKSQAKFLEELMLELDAMKLLR